jgi:hypothetical protein
MVLTANWKGIMTTERDPDQDSDPTVKMPRPTPPVAEELEDIDPDETLVREDWESTVIRRMAPRIAEIHSDVGFNEESFGWESEGLRRLSREVSQREK